MNSVQIKDDLWHNDSGRNSVYVCSEYVDKIFKLERHGISLEQNEEYRQRDFLKELSALQLLEKEFINDPIIDHYPFPKIISSDKENCSIRMTYCGLDLLEYRHFKSFDEVYLVRTIDCIVNNLKNLFIRYYNIRNRNFCINSKHHLHLIDFEASRILASASSRQQYLLTKQSKQFKETIFRYVT